jgi:hypothetical protein
MAKEKVIGVEARVLQRHGLDPITSQQLSLMLIE